MLINDTMRTFVFNQKRRHMAFETIAKNLSDYSMDEVTPEFVKALWGAMCSSGWVKAKRSKQSKDRFPSEGDPVRIAYELRRCNVLHLLDLKRAGHSPTRTEYRITSEGCGVRYPVSQVGSFIGSPAGLCAEPF